jgi:hypothetical protein
LFPLISKSNRIVVEYLMNTGKKSRYCIPWKPPSIFFLGFLEFF